MTGCTVDMLILVQNHLQTIQVINNSRIQKHRFCEVHAYVRAQYAEIYSFLGYEVADIFNHTLIRSKQNFLCISFNYMHSKVAGHPITILF